MNLICIAMIHDLKYHKNDPIETKMLNSRLIELT